MASDLLMLHIFTVSVQHNCINFVNDTEEKYSLPPSLLPSLTKILILPVLWLLLLLIEVINEGVGKAVPIGRRSPDDHHHNQNEAEQEVPETLTKPHFLPVLHVERGGRGGRGGREGEGGREGMVTQSSGNMYQ